MRELFGVQHRQDVRLVLLGVDRPVQFVAVLPTHNACVVPGTHSVEAQRRVPDRGPRQT